MIMIKSDLPPINQKIYELHAEICKIFSNARRLMLLDALKDKELTVTALSELTGISQANISQHLALMRQWDVLEARKEGQHVYYQIADPRLIQVFNLMRKILLTRLEKGGQLAEDTIERLKSLI